MYQVDSLALEKIAWVVFVNKQYIEIGMSGILPLI